MKIEAGAYQLQCDLSTSATVSLFFVLNIISSSPHCHCHHHHVLKKHGAVYNYVTFSHLLHSVSPFLVLHRHHIIIIIVLSLIIDIHSSSSSSYTLKIHLIYECDAYQSIAFVFLKYHHHHEVIATNMRSSMMPELSTPANENSKTKTNTKTNSNTSLCKIAQMGDDSSNLSDWLHPPLTPPQIA